MYRVIYLCMYTDLNFSTPKHTLCGLLAQRVFRATYLGLEITYVIYNPIHKYLGVHVQWIFEVYAICACFIYYYDQYSFTNWGSITELHVYIVYKDIAYRKNNKSSFY